MRIATESSRFDYPSRDKRLSGRRLFPPVSAISAAESVRNAPDESNDANDAGENMDFTCMTRRELLEWTNRQLTDGVMTRDESAPFVAMTVQVSPDGSQIWSDERIDFIQEMRRAMAEAQYRQDFLNAGKFASALRTMQRLQGFSNLLDIHA